MRIGRRGQGGVALLAVLWIVAALSVVVAGLVRSQRDEVRVSIAARQQVAGRALGDAAVQLVLQQLAALPEAPARRVRVVTEFAGLSIPVLVTPQNGLIDLNRAPEGLLALAIRVAGGLDAERAGRLAAAVVQARVPVPGGSTGPRFESVEDLLQVPGVDYDLYARLAPLVTSDSSGNGRVNALAAPQGVLLVLAGGQAERATAIADRRDAGDTGIDTTLLAADFLDQAVGTRYRLQAVVPLADGRRLIATRLVELGRAASDGVPWRIYQSDDRFFSAGDLR